MGILKDAFAPKTRRWIYDIATALYPVLVLLGVANVEHGGAWLTLVASILGVGTNILASSNVTEEE
jgi:hypothetical protein